MTKLQRERAVVRKLVIHKLRIGINVWDSGPLCDAGWHLPMTKKWASVTCKRCLKKHAALTRKRK